MVNFVCAYTLPVTPLNLARISHLFALSFAVVVQNPGRVVTLIHQEDWASFSGAVSFIFSVLSFTHKPNSK